MSDDVIDDNSPDSNDLASDVDDNPIDSKSDQQVSRFASLENIDFSFVAYDQDITIMGAKSSGKSYLANTIL